MPIKLPADLPAFRVLTEEGVMVMSEARAERQDIRPLRIGLLNLMPKKIQTETQFARLIGATPLQIELNLIRMTEPRDPQHRRRAHGGVLSPVSGGQGREVRRPHHYRRADRAPAVRGGHLLGRAGRGDGLDPDQRALDLRRLLGRHGDDPPLPRRAKAHAAAEGLRLLPPREPASASPYLRGFSDDCVIPVSRWTEMRQDETSIASRRLSRCSARTRSAPAWSRTRRIGRSTSSTTSNTTATR